LGYEVYEAGVDNNFFNRYTQEECAIWDDYRSGPITFNTLLNITDRTGCMINIKGSKVFFKPKIFIFTSPEGIDSAKTKEMNEKSSLDNKFDQLKRRIKYQVTIENDLASFLTKEEFDQKYNIKSSSILYDDTYIQYQKYCNEFKPSIPTFDIVEQTSNKIVKEFLGVFKTHLIDNGFQEYIDNHKVLKDIECIKSKPLIELSNKVNLTFKSNSY
jgi:hypothetical protein